MNDVSILEKVIAEREKRYIELDDPITPELLDLLVNTTCSVFDTLFKPSMRNFNADDIHRHVMSIICNKCGKLETKIYNITTIRSVVHKLRKDIPVLCEECALKDVEEEKRIKEEERITRIHNASKDYRQDESVIKKKIDSKLSVREQNTVDYINNYLTFDDKTRWDFWKEPYIKWQEISSINMRSHNMKKITEHIKAMQYQDFLQTPYWKTVAYYVKWKSKFACILCNAESKLVTHHKTYEHHGMEHAHWKTDLLCVCSECHEKLHRK